jgi:hypothetical protein
MYDTMYDAEITPEQRKRMDADEKRKKEALETHRESERVRLEQEKAQKREQVEASEKAAAKRQFMVSNRNATDEDFERLWPQLRDKRMLNTGGKRRVSSFYKSNF